MRERQKAVKIAGRATMPLIITSQTRILTGLRHRRERCADDHERGTLYLNKVECPLASAHPLKLPERSSLSFAAGKGKVVRQ